VADSDAAVAADLVEQGRCGQQVIVHQLLLFFRAFPRLSGYCWARRKSGTNHTVVDDRS
jgi:hypothetical protein